MKLWKYARFSFWVSLRHSLIWGSKYLETKQWAPCPLAARCSHQRKAHVSSSPPDCFYQGLKNSNNVASWCPPPVQTRRIRWKYYPLLHRHNLIWGLPMMSVFDGKISLWKSCEWTRAYFFGAKLRHGWIFQRIRSTEKSVRENRSQNYYFVVVFFIDYVLLCDDRCAKIPEKTAKFSTQRARRFLPLLGTIPIGTALLE